MPAPYPISTGRHDPYKAYKFRIKWNGRYVAGVSKISSLKQSTEPVTHREGGDPSTTRVMPSAWKFEPITLERGITQDNEFEDWARLIYSTDGDAAISLKEFRKNVIIELLNEEGKRAKVYNVFNCWVSEYSSLPELDANGNSVAIETIVLQNEGWVRDEDGAEVSE